MVAEVVLAAGRSTRMGAHKLLLPLGNRPVIAHVVGAALASRLRPVVVVVGHEAARVRAVIPSDGALVVDNAEYAHGLATSLHAGLRALPNDTTGTVVSLGDQPLLTSVELERMAECAKASGAPIVVACYGGQRGNPVYFARSCFPDLFAVSGDEGGRVVVTDHPGDVVVCELGDAAASLDVDTPDDYVRVCAIWEHRHPAP